MSKSSIPEPVLGMATVFAVGAVIWDKRYVIAEFFVKLVMVVALIALAAGALFVLFLLLRSIVSAIWRKIQRIRNWFIRIDQTFMELGDEVTRINKKIERINHDVEILRKNDRYFNSEIKSLRDWTQLDQHEEILAREKEREKVSKKAAAEVTGGGFI